MSMTSHSVVCATCGIDVPWEEQFCVGEKHDIVCPRCAREKFGVNVDVEMKVDKLDKERWD